MPCIVYFLDLKLDVKVEIIQRDAKVLLLDAMFVAQNVDLEF